MAEIIWTAEAEQWLKDIYDFIAIDNPDAAKRVVEGIYERAQVLLRFPETGYWYDMGSGENIRILLYGHYRIAYLVRQDGNINILGIFHGALDISRYLF